MTNIVSPKEKLTRGNRWVNNSNETLDTKKRISSKGFCRAKKTIPDSG